MYRHDPDDPGSLADNNLRVITADRYGALWVGYYQGGASRLDPRSGKFVHFKHEQDDPRSLSNDVVKAIFSDQSGDLWIGTYAGLNRYDHSSGSFDRIQYDPQNPNGLTNNNVLCITELASDGGQALWLGTFGGGVNRYDKATGTVTAYTYGSGLPNNVVYGMLPDDGGRLWISTNRGISRFDPKAGVFRNFDVSDGLQSNEFNTGSFHRGASGLMYFGGVNGFNVFHPDSIRDNDYVPPVVITSVRKFDQLISDNVMNGDTLVLSYDDKYLTFEFASLDYANPSKNRYAFSMKGFDDTWNSAGTRRFASYTNLYPGEYLFRVNATNHDGVWNTEGASLRVIIRPPFWLTWWFIGLSAIIALGSALVVYKLRVRSKLEKARFISELKAAHDVQMGLMPRGDPTVTGLDVSGMCIPANEVGGDFYDYLWLDQEHTRFAVALADVSGKAMNAAMTAVMTSGMVYREIENNQPPGEILKRLNKAMYRKTDRQVFTAMLMAAIDLPKKLLTLANAGQSLPILKRDGTLRYLQADGNRFPLGARDNTVYEETSVQLRAGDILVFYTDGLPEARNDTQGLFDFEKIEEVMQAVPPSASASDMVQALVTKVQEFSACCEQQDDMTIVVLKVL
jgi:serine phosphatase RsbU (regulator of sigma subunit)/sugar lactone lactonase YvrE